MKHDPEALLAAVRELDIKTNNLDQSISVLNHNDGPHIAAVELLEAAKLKLKADFKAPTKKKAQRQPVGNLVESSFDYLATTTSQNVAAWAKENGLNVASVRKAIAKQKQVRQAIDILETAKTQLKADFKPVAPA